MPLSVTSGFIRVTFVLTLGRRGAHSLLYSTAQILLSHKKIANCVSPALTQLSVYSPSQEVSNISSPLESLCTHLAFVEDDDQEAWAF